MGRHGLFSRPRGRSSLDATQYRLLILDLAARSLGASSEEMLKQFEENERWGWEAMRVCEVCGATTRPIDPHHIIPRSQGGPDGFWNMVLLCRRDHEAINAPYSKGRLVLELFSRPASQHEMLAILDGAPIEAHEAQRSRGTFHGWDGVRASMVYGRSKREIVRREVIKVIWLEVP